MSTTTPSPLLRYVRLCLCLVEDGQLFLPLVALDDAGHLAGVLGTDLLHVLHPQRCIIFTTVAVCATNYFLVLQ